MIIAYNALTGYLPEGRLHNGIPLLDLLFKALLFVSKTLQFDTAFTPSVR